MFDKDEWSGLADLLANLIEKYAAELDIDNLPDPKKSDQENREDLPAPGIEISTVA